MIAESFEWLKNITCDIENANGKLENIRCNVNKFTKIFAFIVLAALYSSTTLPMNHLARVAAKMSKFAPKITPARAARHGRLFGSVPNLSSRKQDDVNLLPNFNKNGKQQRIFARSHPWLAALGAAAALGLNAQQEKAECLTVGYGIFFLNPYTLLVTIDDAHLDPCIPYLATEHTHQITDILDYAETLKNLRIFYNIEAGEGVIEGLRNGKIYPFPTLMTPIKRSIEKNNGNGIIYENFDLRPPLHLVPELYKGKTIGFFIREAQKEAQKIVQQADVKSLDLAALNKHFASLDPSKPGDAHAFYGLASDTYLGCNIAKQAEKAEKAKQPTLIFSHAGAGHNGRATALLKKHPATYAGTWSGLSMAERVAKLKSREEREELFIDFAAPIIAEVENWRKQQEQSPGKLAGPQKEVRPRKNCVRSLLRSLL